MKQNPIIFDLQERTAKLAELIIDTLRLIPITSLNKRIIEQLIGSSGAIGANYCEATESESKRDFIHKMSISKKETKETLHWLRLLARTNPETANTLRMCWKETHEILLIFSKIVRSCHKTMC